MGFDLLEIVVLSDKHFLVSLFEFIDDFALFFELFSKATIFFIFIDKEFDSTLNIFIILFLSSIFRTSYFFLSILMSSSSEIAIDF